MLTLLSIAVGGALSIVSIAAAGKLIFPGIALPFAIRFTTGAALLSTLICLVLSAHVAWWPVWVVVPVLLAALVRDNAPMSSRRAMPVFFRTVLVISGAAYLIYALAPEIQADAAGYHLRLVADYVRAHGFTGRVGFYDVLPQGLEMLFVPAYAFGAGPAAKLVHFAFLATTVSLIRELAHEAGLTDFQACAAATLFFLAPVSGVDGSAAYTDAGLVCACLTLIYLLIRWNRERLPGLLVCAAINAGFCYAIKPTFGWAALVALIFVAARGARLALTFAATAVAIAGPWLTRAWALAGSPLAPFLSGWIPNAVMTPDVERHLSAQYGILRTAFDWNHLWSNYTVFGDNQGIFGPAFLLVPLAFLTLRNSRTRWLVCCALLLTVPFLFNTGARFLMPAMALIAIAMVAVLPRSAAVALVTIQAIAAVPAVMNLYDRAGDWRLGALPLASALQLETEPHYLRRTIPGFEATEMITRNTPPDARILACSSMADAYIPRELLTWWHSKRGLQFADALHFAMMSQGTRARLVSWRWRENQYDSLRLTALSDLRVVAANLPHSDKGLNTWRMYRTGETVSLPAPSGANGADFLIWPGDQAREKTEVRPSAGSWRTPDGAVERTACYLDLRRDATAYIRRSGYRYIAIPAADDAFAEIGRDMVRHPEQWGVHIAGEAAGVYLLEIKAALL